MEIIDAPQLENTIPTRYAGFWLRFVAVVIDGIIISIVQWLILIPVLALFGVSMFAMSGLQNINVNKMNDSSYGEIIALMVSAYLGIFFFSTLFSWLYYALMESSPRQATIGKIILNLQVSDMQGNRISFLNATGRYFGKIISSLFLMIGYIMAGFTEKKQALHDIMAGTLVIQK